MIRETTFEYDILTAAANRFLSLKRGAELDLLLEYRLLLLLPYFNDSNSRRRFRTRPDSTTESSFRQIDRCTSRLRELGRRMVRKYRPQRLCLRRNETFPRGFLPRLSAARSGIIPHLRDRSRHFTSARLACLLDCRLRVDARLRPASLPERHARAWRICVTQFGPVPHRPFFSDGVLRIPVRVSRRALPVRHGAAMVSCRPRRVCRFRHGHEVRWARLASAVPPSCLAAVGVGPAVWPPTRGIVAAESVGLAAYMGYQWQAFGEPLAFIQTQANWRVYRPSSLAEKGLALATFKPIWGTFTPSAPAYWLRHTFYPNPFVSLSLLNPMFFVAAVVLLLLGLRQRWLSSYEVLLAGGLLLIPYVASSYEMHMAGMGRFVAAIFPLHLVLGQLLTRLRGPLAAGLLCISACLLALCAALFAAWYQIY